MVDTVTAGATMASVRLMPNPRLLLSLTTDMEDTEATEDTDMVDTVLATAGATTASVRLRLSPTMATEDTVVVMEDMVDIVLEVTEASEVTVMAMASNMFPNCP